MNWHSLTTHELLDQLKSRKVTGDEILKSVRGQIDRVESKIHAYIRLNESNNYAISETDYI